ncbi:MAG TPA: helix-turn-helix transcriptional regulator [bacterium]|nr:helix-turn-helix transcriptional regulator [bacterium]
MEFDATAQQRLTANPLWRWRIANRRDAREVEGMLGLPPGRVQAWELGVATPHQAELRRLASVTGIADLEAQWRAWAVG